MPIQTTTVYTKERLLKFSGYTAASKWYMWPILIVDLLAVFVIAFTRANPRSLQDNNDYEKKLTLPQGQFPIVLLGLGWGSLSYFSAWVMLWLHPDSTADQISSLIFVSFIICQLLILLSISNPSVFSGQGIRVNAIYLIAVLLCVGFILLSFFNGAVQGFFTMAPIEKDGIWIIFIPALGTLILTELYKLYRDRGQSKRSNLPKKKKTLT